MLTSSLGVDERPILADQSGKAMSSAKDRRYPPITGSVQMKALTISTNLEDVAIPVFCSARNSSCLNSFLSSSKSIEEQAPTVRLQIRIGVDMLWKCGATSVVRIDLSFEP